MQQRPRISLGVRGRCCDVCEALIGAVFVDGGYPAAAALVERLWSERMRTPSRPLQPAANTSANAIETHRLIVAPL